MLNRFRIWVVASLLALAPAASAAPAEEQDQADTINQIVALNKDALLAYNSLEIDTASALLHQALKLCKSHGLAYHPLAARTHLHLGVVYISGRKLSELGETEFRAAIDIDPTIRLPKSLVNPEVQAAFEEALWWETAPKDLSKRIPFPTGHELPAPAAAEPDLAVERIWHPLVTQATRGKPVEIKAQVPPGMGAAKLVLAYMAQHDNEFWAREMKPLPDTPGLFREFIPGEATKGSWVAYYLEARDEEDEPLVRHGSADAPHQITLIPEGGTSQPTASDAGSQGKTRARGSTAPGLWVVLALGSGVGYHSGAPEMNPTDANANAIHVSGLGAAQLLHVAPEIGYFHSSQLVFSAQGRLQYVTGTQEIKVGMRRYRPAALALAGLVKATWLFAKPGGRLHPFVNVQAGGGQLRHTITTPASANLSECDGNTCKDTVLGGPALLGAGGGLGYLVSHGLGLYAACNLLAGFPHFVINADFNVGVILVR